MCNPLLPILLCSVNLLSPYRLACSCPLPSAQSQQADGLKPARPACSPQQATSGPHGLLPGTHTQLVAEKNKTDPPYSPISPLDVERTQLAPPAEPTAYLASRLDKFYAELRVGAPGLLTGSFW